MRVENFQPTSMFSLMGEKPEEPANDVQLLLDDDVRKLERLQIINASARYELLSANAQLIDFHLNRVLKAKFSKKNPKRMAMANETIGEVNEIEERQSEEPDQAEELESSLPS